MSIVKQDKGRKREQQLDRIEELLSNHIIHRLDDIESEQKRQGALIDQLILNDGDIVDAIHKISKRLDKVKIPQ